MVRAWDGMLNIRAGNKVASFIYYEGNKLRRRTKNKKAAPLFRSRLDPCFPSRRLHG